MIRALLKRAIVQQAGLLGLLSLGLFFFEWALVWVAARLDISSSFREMFEALLPPMVVDTMFSQFGFATFEGAVSFGYQHPLALIAAIAMVVVVATRPAQERETGFLDLILARPITRARYLAAHGLLVSVASLLPPIALLAGGAFGLVLVGAPAGVSWTGYLPSAAAMALLLLAVGAYSLLFATGATRRGVATAQAVGVTLLLYWLDFMGDYWDTLQTARLFSPFHYFDPAGAASSGIPFHDAAVLAGIAAVATGTAFFNFRRQDL